MIGPTLVEIINKMMGPNPSPVAFTILGMGIVIFSGTYMYAICYGLGWIKRNKS